MQSTDHSQTPLNQGPGGPDAVNKPSGIIRLANFQTSISFFVSHESLNYTYLCNFR